MSAVLHLIDDGDLDPLLLIRAFLGQGEELSIHVSNRTNRGVESIDIYDGDCMAYAVTDDSSFVALEVLVRGLLRSAADRSGA